MPRQNTTNLTGVKAVTTNATEATLAYFETQADRVYHIEARVRAVEADDHDEAASYLLVGTFKNDGGVLTQVGTTTELHAEESTGGWAADLDADGTQIRVRVTGAADTNINWQVDADIYEGK